MLQFHTWGNFCKNDYVVQKNIIRDETDCMPVDNLANVTGGLYTREERILLSKVKCPVTDCGFECDSFIELNRHMRESHLDYIRR